MFAAGDPMPASRIALVLGVDTDEVFDCAREIADEYSYNMRGIRLGARPGFPAAVLRAGACA